MKDVHHFLVRVYYADTDLSGFVYHARYLEFMERGRTDFLCLMGICHAQKTDNLHEEQLVWIVKHMEIDFRVPAQIDDTLVVETKIVDLSGARIFIRQSIMREDVILVCASVQAAITNYKGRPRRFPKKWIDGFRSLMDSHLKLLAE